MKKFAAFYFSYFYFFGYFAEKVRVFFAATEWLPSAV